MSRSTIAVIDYGMGNLRSVSRALAHVAPEARIDVTNDARVIEAADRIVCPGQGAAADCMAALRRTGMDAVVREVLDRRPFLGICMGLQVLLSDSEENGGVACLDLVPGTVRRFVSPLLDANGGRLKVPHMGWSPVHRPHAHPLWQGISTDARFYFAHSYHAVPAHEGDIAATADYGGEIVVAVSRPGLFACQFHPEKSAADGLRLLHNFATWDGQC